MRVTTNGPPPNAALPLRTASGREVYSGDTVTPEDPIVLPAVDGTSGTLTIGVSPAGITAVSTLGPNGVRHVDFTDNPIELRAGEQITATPHADGTVSVTISGKPYPAQWWNNIRRAWFTGPANAPVMVDPQPPAPSPVAEALGIVNDVVPDIRRAFLPPAVKVSA